LIRINCYIFYICFIPLAKRRPFGDEKSRRIMLKIAIILWIVLGSTLAGSALIVVLATPVLADQAMKLIPWAALAGFVLAMPLSWLLASNLSAPRIR
jgi:hypothetical protein